MAYNLLLRYCGAAESSGGMRKSKLWVVATMMAACGGSLDVIEKDTAEPGPNETDGIASKQFSAKVYSIANKVIMATRPKATELLLGQLNLVLANNDVWTPWSRPIRSKTGCSRR